MIVSKSRDSDLRYILAYELSAVPISLAHSDGTLRKNSKSSLLAVLETGIESFGRLPEIQSSLQTAFVVDAIAVLQMVKPLGLKTFGALADRYWETFTRHLNEHGCNRIDIIF